MKTILLTALAAAALGLAACDRAPEQGAGSGASGAAPSTPQSTTPTTPANLGKPGPDDGHPTKEQPPVQGREDVRQPEQRRDFQQKGDEAGPKPGG